MILELTELVKDFTSTGLLSKIELDFLEAELWETFQHIEEVTSLTIAPSYICKDLSIKDGSCWQLCCAAVLDSARPEKESRTDKLVKLLEEYSLSN